MALNQMGQKFTFAAWRAFFISFLKTPETRSVGLVFTVLSWCFASWLVHIPHVKTSLGLTDGQLGWVLFGLPIGHLFINTTPPPIITVQPKEQTVLTDVNVTFLASAPTKAARPQKNSPSGEGLPVLIDRRAF